MSCVFCATAIRGHLSNRVLESGGPPGNVDPMPKDLDPGFGKERRFGLWRKNPLSIEVYSWENSLSMEDSASHVSHV